mgnify:FL=1
MRNKTPGINVRVTPDEKEKLCQNAKYCGLSLSEYLRKTGLCKELETAFREKDYRIFRLLKQLKVDCGQLEKNAIIFRVDEILKELR